MVLEKRYQESMAKGEGAGWTGQYFEDPDTHEVISEAEYKIRMQEKRDRGGPEQQ